MSRAAANPSTPTLDGILYRDCFDGELEPARGIVRGTVAHLGEESACVWQENQFKSELVSRVLIGARGCPLSERLQVHDAALR